MARVATAVVGGAIGFALGGPFGAKVGLTVGLAAGSYLFPASAPNSRGPRLQSLEGSTAAEGTPIPLLYGNGRVVCNPIWMLDLEEVTTETEQEGGKGGAPSGGSSSTTTYFWTAALLAGEPGLTNGITGIRRVWANKKLIYDKRTQAEFEAEVGPGIPFSQVENELANEELFDSVRFYLGSDTQEPDPTIQADRGIGRTPAYKGLVYIVINRMDLTDFGNTRPTIEIEYVSGQRTEPSLKIFPFPTTLSVHRALYQNGLWTRAEFALNDPMNGQSRQVITTRDLHGNLIDRREFVGSNPNGTSLGGFVPINGRPELAFFNGGAIDANSSWWSFNFGGEGINIPGAPRPWEGLGFSTAVGGNVAVGDLVFAENYGPMNVYGIARYPLGAGGVGFIPSALPDAFFNLEENGYLPSSGLSVSEIFISKGVDDDLIYVTRSRGLRFLGNKDVIVLNQQLEFVRDIALENNPIQADSGTVYCEGRFITSSKDGLMSQGFMSTHDVTPEAIAGNGGVAPIIGFNQHDMETGRNDIVPLAAGLFLARDGIWSMKGIATVEPVTVADIFQNGCQRGGLAPGQINFGDTDTLDVRGYKTDQPLEVRGLFDGLSPTYQWDYFESGGQMKAKVRGGTSLVSLREDDLGASIGEPPARQFVRTRQQEVELPRKVTLAFSDVAQDYQVSAVPALTFNTESLHELDIEQAIVLTSQEAQRAVEVFQTTLWHERDRYKFQLPRRFGYLEPADLVDVKEDATNVLLRLIKIAKGRDGILQLEAVRDTADNYISIAEGHPLEDNNSQTLGFKGPTKLVVIDVANLLDTSAENEPGYYLAGQGFSTAWVGAAVRRNDDGVSNSQVGFLNKSAVCGFCTDILADFPGFGTDVFSHVNVVLPGGGQLFSVTDEQFLNGENAALIGDEIVYFRDAALETDGSYTISHLARHIRHTAILGSHLISESFLFLDPSTIVSASGSLDDLGVQGRFFATTSGAANQTAALTEKELNNNRIKPPPPWQAMQIVTATGEIKLRWRRSDRRAVRFLSTTESPLDELTERYELVFKDTFGEEIRTEIVEDVIEYDYTVTQQSLDYGTIGALQNIDIYQLSDRVGRGRRQSFTQVDSVSGVSQYLNTILADQPSNGWNFENTVADSIGGIMTFVEIGGLGIQWNYSLSPITGEIGGIESLSTDYRIRGDHVPEMNFGSIFSFELVIRTSLITGAKPALIWAKGSKNIPDDNDFLVSLLPGGGGEVAMSVRTETSVLTEKVISTGPALNDDKNHHLVFTYDNSIGGAHEMKMYVDGVLNNTVPIVSAEGDVMQISNFPMWFIWEIPIAPYDSYTNGASGPSRLYVPYIYNDKVLSASRVADHYAASGLALLP